MLERREVYLAAGAERSPMLEVDLRLADANRRNVFSAAHIAA